MSTPTKHCQVCNTEFAEPSTCSKRNWELRSFCSKTCSNSRPSQVEGVKVDGIAHGTLTSYNAPHNCRCFECREVARIYRQRSRAGILVPKEELGLKGEDNPNWGGKTITDEMRRQSSERAKERLGAKHPAWKGDEAGYGPVHAWVTRHKTKTGVCIHCEEERTTQWANVDHQYRRDLDDYIELCPRCHAAYDQQNNLRKRVLA